MRRPTAATVVIALLLGILAGAAFSNVLTARSSAQTASYRYGHLAFIPIAPDRRVLAVDLRNGDVWGVTDSYPPRGFMGGDTGRSSSLDPEYRGNFGLDRLEEVKAKFLEGRQ